MEVSDARRMRSLEYEIAKLKQLLSYTMLNNVALKDLITKNWLRPLQGAEQSLVSGSGWMSERWAAVSPKLIAGACITSPGGHRRPSCAPVCASLPTSSTGSATVVGHLLQREG